MPVRAPSKTAYQRYLETRYGPGVTSHKDSSGNYLDSFASAFNASYGRPRVGADIAPGAGGGGYPARVSAPQSTYSGTPNEASGGPGAGLSSPSTAGGNASIQHMLDTISQHEGTTKNGYNEVLGSGAYGRPPRDLTDMTLKEVYDFGRSTLGPNWVAKTGKPMSTASGRYQIVGNTMMDMASRLGLDPATTKFTRSVQDRMALEIARTQGLSAWASLNTTNGQKVKAQIIQQLGGPAAYKQTIAQAAGGTNFHSVGADPAERAQVAQLQKDLNNRGANLAVDGIMGPLTRAAQQKYSTNTTYASGQQDEGQVRAGVKAPVQVASAAPDMGATRGVTIGPKRDLSITANPHTPAFMNPYTTSTGGANAIGTAYNAYEAQRNAARLGPTVAPRTVQAVDISGSPMPPRPFQPAETARIPTARPNYIPGQSSYTSGRGDEGVIPAAGVAGANAWSSLQGAYPTSPTSRIPQPRPPGLQWSQLQQSVPAVQEQAVPAPAANWTLADIQRWADQHGIPVTKAAGVLSDIGSRAEHAFSEGSRSGMGYSGGNYSGGTYGGAGGRSISSGVGGAFKNR